VQDVQGCRPLPCQLERSDRGIFGRSLKSTGTRIVCNRSMIASC
jgi:hypothetical protein